MKNPNHAQIINNLYSHINKYANNTNIDIESWINPYDNKNVDHDILDNKPIYGMIISGHFLNYISGEDNLKDTIFIKTNCLNVMLKDTIFGYYVSGVVPIEESNLNKTVNNVLIQSVEDTELFEFLAESDIDDNLHDRIKTLIYYSDFEELNSLDKLPVPKCPDELLFSSEHKLRHELGILWDKETLGIYSHELHHNDEVAMNLFKESVKKCPITGQYIVKLPFNDKKPLLVNNIRMCFARARQHQAAMLDKHLYRNQFEKALDMLLKENYIEKVNMNEQVKGPIVYLPYKGVVRDNHPTTKCRIVMDASAKPNINAISLNQALYTGPNKIADIVMCLLRFMVGKYACISDIKQAFLRIWISLHDRDALRFLVPDDIFDMHSKMICYRYTSLVFGSVASPFLLAAVLEKHITDNCNNNMVKNALLNNTYVDNISFSNDCEDNMCDFFIESTKVMESGSFQLRQWSSNSPKLMQLVKDNDVQNNDSIVKVLGIMWNTIEDCIFFNESLKWDKFYCKRSVLSTTNSVFDPMGYISPVLMQNKLFLQKLWNLDFKWDKDFEDNNILMQEWDHLLSDCEVAVRNVTILREIKVDRNTEIHVFCDASSTSYGACIYILNPPINLDTKGNSKLVFAKGKIKPKNTVDNDNTIPKLELTAMLVGARLVGLIQTSLAIDKSNNVYLWSDALVVLQWLSSQDIDSAYVHRRVVAIRESCPGAILMHVKTLDNPADIITRPIKVDKFIKNDLWWRGPNWLVEKKHNWPIQEIEYNLSPPLIDIQSININIAIVKEFDISFNFKDESIQTLLQISMVDRCIELKEKSILKFFDTYDFTRSMKVLIYVFRLAHSTQFHKNLNKSFGNIFQSNLGQFEFAKLKAILIMQKECFSTEKLILDSGKNVESGPCRGFGLRYDELGIIRCTTKAVQLNPISELGPILVAPKHPFVMSYIYSLHYHSNCASRNYTLNRVRREIHGPGLKVMINRLVQRCFICKKHRCKYLRFTYPRPKPLPIFRTKFLAPYVACGVDLAGPYKVIDGLSNIKVWITLFTCLVTRAIYLVLVKDLRASTFFRALKELSCRHSTPLLLLSDNATNFAATNRLLKEISQHVPEFEKSEGLNLEWKFIPVKAPWTGGVYERLIGNLKSNLDKMNFSQSIKIEEFREHLYECERVINDRPLQQVGDNEVITPAMLLYGRKLGGGGTLSSIYVDNLLEDSKYLQKILPQIYRDNIRRRKKFWEAFQADYLDSLRLSDAPPKLGDLWSKRIPRVGDLIMIHDVDSRIKPKRALVLE
ncbi:unnamed protein product, partial [Meganyctiphanes norvegica]